ncbi:MAG: hypothetical protein QXN45_02370 [Candidatus Thermoplasmatota archaeon]
MRERNWKEYNEQLVRRGEFYISCLCSCRFSSISSDGRIFKEVI